MRDRVEQVINRIRQAVQMDGGDVGYGFGGHITMDGSARIRFVPLTQAPPGFEPGVWNGQTTQSPAPTVLLWDGG